MNKRKVVISGTGCALTDFLYTDINFESPAFLRYQSVSPGDGGLSPGKLVFTEELEEFAGTPYPEILKDITGEQEPVTVNAGGPGLVSMINTSQLLQPEDFEVRFYGGTGSDKTAGPVYEIMRQTPLNNSSFRMISSKPAPFTDVFSDPSYNQGHGERTFVNNIGAAWDYSPDFLDDSFFNSDIVCFGGTALVPQIHDNLTSLLEKAKRNNCITVVNTVFDFRNEKANPFKPWPLGRTDESLKLIDLLITDREEALKISGTYSMDQASRVFTEKGLGAFIITNGPNPLYAYSGNGIFRNKGLKKFPVSDLVMSEIAADHLLKGDTTGCGDNLVGAVVASMAWQIQRAEDNSLDLTEAVMWGVASGGFTCCYFGGAFIESSKGEKYVKVNRIREAYLKQINESRPMPG
jgi:sugar/nucleoside kinase (ribokinase family)